MSTVIIMCILLCVFLINTDIHNILNTYPDTKNVYKTDEMW
jgi:hypothetical protein